jgi:hypothetical protein
MLRLQAIYGDNNVQIANTRPSSRDLSNCACHDLNGETHFVQPGEQNIQFSISYERFSANDREVKRTVPLNEIHNTIHQGLSFIFGKGLKWLNRMEMFRFIGVTARTAERTLAGNLN